MGEYRDDRKVRWLVGHGWCIDQESGRAFRGNSMAIRPCTYMRTVKVPATELDGLDLGLNARERKVYLRLKREGKTVLRAGWPDLLVIDGDDVYGLEVKAPGDKLNARQVETHAALKSAGLRVEVEKVR
jgi:hypothetical protein